MSLNDSTEISLNSPCRVIESVTGDKCCSRFLVGSCLIPPLSYSIPHGKSIPISVKSDVSNIHQNQLHLLRYHEEMNELILDASLGHPNGEILSLTSCPTDPYLAFTCGKIVNEKKYRTVLWRIPDIALRDDEPDFVYKRGDNYETFSDVSRFVDINMTSGSDIDTNLKLEKICELEYSNSSVRDAESYCHLLTGRMEDMRWNLNNSTGYQKGCEYINGSSGCNLLTASYGVPVNGIMKLINIVETWDISTSVVRKLLHIPVLSSVDHVELSRPRVTSDPQSNFIIAATAGCDTIILDLRQNHNRGFNVTAGLKECHRIGISDLDYNPIKPNILSTAGKDGVIKFWDLRFLSSLVSADKTKIKWQIPIKTVNGGHTEWVSAFRYNHSHDQLCLSCGTDRYVNLWSLSSISSSPLLELGNNINGSLPENNISDFGYKECFDFFQKKNEKTDDDKFNSINNEDKEFNGVKTADDRVMGFEMTEAVYDVTWSAANAWVFLAVAFDGCVQLNHVPTKEKYKILL